MKEFTILLLPPQLIINTENYPSPTQLFLDWKHLPPPSKIGGNFFAAIGVMGVDYLEVPLVKKCMQTFALPPSQDSTKKGYSTLHWILRQFTKKSKERSSILVKPQTGIKSESGPRVPPAKVKKPCALTFDMIDSQKRDNPLCKES
jgi:hypothetical protein